MNRIFGLLAVWFLGSAPALVLSQAGPDFGKGLVPFAVYDSTAIDNVNMTNGNVYVHIPLLSYPQRGKSLNLSFSIMGNARVWECGLQLGVPTVPQATPCTWQMVFSLPGATFVPDAGAAGAYVTSDQNGYIAPTMSELPDLSCSNQPCSTGLPFANYAYYAPDGGVHYFYSTRANNGGQISGAGYTTGGYPASDGSGYTPPASGYFVGQAVDRNGVVVGGGIQSDADGNLITLADNFGNGGPTAYTDTLGRSIPDPGVGTIPAPTTNCPTFAHADSAGEWTVPGPGSVNGGLASYYLCYALIMPHPEFPGHPFVLPTSPVRVLVAIVLPDKTYYQFGYDNFLEIDQIMLPTGGIVNYTFADIPLGTDLYRARVVASRTTLDGVNPPATTNYTWTLQGDDTAFNVKTDPLGNDEVHTIYAYIDGIDSTNDIQTDSYQGCSPYKGTGCIGTGTIQPLKSVVRGYKLLPKGTTSMLVSFGGPPGRQSRIATEVTTLNYPNGTTLSSYKGYTYIQPQVAFEVINPYNLEGDYSCVCGEFNQIQSVEEDDYINGTGGSGAIRTTTTHYKWEDPTPIGNSTVGGLYLAAGLIDLPRYTTVTGQLNSAETDYYYDETPPVPSSITTQLFNAYARPVRGHLTSVERAVKGSGTQGGLVKRPGDPVTTTSWYDTGVPYQTVDPNVNPPTTYSYASAYSGAYVTSTVDPIGNSVSATYDFNTGLMTSFTGVNNSTETPDTTTYTYDTLRRPLKISYPDGAEHLNTYNVNLPAGKGNVVVQDSIDSSRLDMHTVVYDGFGREIETQHNTDATATTYVDTAYDQNGHVGSVSNPYRTKSDVTYGLTYTSYDALGRETSSVLPDGSTTSTNYSAMQYANSGYGLSKTYTDPNKNQTVWVSDAGGRLRETIENYTGANNLPALTTTYSYDTLDNLWNVMQQGSGGSSAPPRSRSFNYDSLSRLTYSSNPETGPISYIYDLDSNLTTKTDARHIVTAYKYDSLNRLVSKTYTADPAHTPFSCYWYGINPGYSLERLAGQWTELPSATPCASPTNALTNRSFSQYDSRGRILNEQQCIVGSSCSKNSYPNTYSYDLAGHLINFGNLVGTAFFTNSYDSGGRLSTLTENWSGSNVAPLYPFTLFSAATYAPHGALAAATYGQNPTGTNLTISRTYDSRLRILGESDSGTTVQTPATQSSGTLTITGALQSH